MVVSACVAGDCEIGAEAIVDRAILDKNVTVGKKAHVGCGLDLVSSHGGFSEKRAGGDLAEEMGLMSG